MTRGEKEFYTPENRILLALYSEWLKDKPDLSHVNPASMEMDMDVFLWGMIKLKTLGFVDGVSWQQPYVNALDKVISVTWDNVMMTGDGVREAGKIVAIPKERRAEIWMHIADVFKELGIGVMTGLITRNLG